MHIRLQNDKHFLEKTNHQEMLLPFFYYWFFKTLGLHFTISRFPFSKTEEEKRESEIIINSNLRAI